jgi:Flp pilus assembly protein protease CpaA
MDGTGHGSPGRRIGGGVLLLFYLGGGMGAGDFELMAAASVLSGLGHVVEALLATMLLSGLFALGYALFNRRLGAVMTIMVTLIVRHGKDWLPPHLEIDLTDPLTLRLPYGSTVAAGVSWNALRSKSMNPCRLVIAPSIALLLSRGMTFFLNRKIGNRGTGRPQTCRFEAASRPTVGRAAEARNLAMVDWPEAVPVQGDTTKWMSWLGVR